MANSDQRAMRGMYASPSGGAVPRDYRAALAMYGGENKAGPVSDSQQAKDYALSRDPLAEGDADVSDPRWQRLTGNAPGDVASREEKALAREFLRFAGLSAAGSLALPAAARGANSVVSKVRDARSAASAPRSISDPAYLYPVERGPAIHAADRDFWVPR